MTRSLHKELRLRGCRGFSCYTERIRHHANTRSRDYPSAGPSCARLRPHRRLGLALSLQRRAGMPTKTGKRAQHCRDDAARGRVRKYGARRDGRAGRIGGNGRDRAFVEGWTWRGARLAPDLRRNRDAHQRRRASASLDLRRESLQLASASGDDSRWPSIPALRGPSPAARVTIRRRELLPLGGQRSGCIGHLGRKRGGS
jgi:hypothetical protein